MIDWNNISEDEMRAAVIDDVKRKRDEILRQAERNEKSAADRVGSFRDRRIGEACARYSRRQAAHYQQAIDLLTAAPMPASEEGK